MTEVQVQLRRLPHAADLPLPSYATAGAAGMDVCAAVTEPVTIPPAAAPSSPPASQSPYPPATNSKSAPAPA